MRLVIPLFCLLAVLWSGCSKSKPEAKAKKPEIGPAMIVLGTDGRAKRRDTDEVFSGLVVQRSPEGRIISSVNFKDGRRDGLSRAWHPSGGKKSEEEWKEGQQHHPSRRP